MHLIIEDTVNFSRHPNKFSTQALFSPKNNWKKNYHFRYIISKSRFDSWASRDPVAAESRFACYTQCVRTDLNPPRFFMQNHVEQPICHKDKINFKLSTPIYMAVGCLIVFRFHRRLCEREFNYQFEAWAHYIGYR
jgi:hypothetical protein